MIWLWGYLCGVILTLMLCGIVRALILRPEDGVRSISLEPEPCILAIVWPVTLAVGLAWLIANAVYLGSVLIVCIIIGQLKTKGTK